MSRAVYVFSILLSVAIAVSGCDRREEKKNIPVVMSKTEKARLQKAGQAKISQKSTGASTNAVIKSISDNPAFYTMKEINARSLQVKDIDACMRPVLKKLFGEAKIIEESSAPEKKIDGEVVENRFTYVTKMLLTIEDGVALHEALGDAHFGASPRLGRKPSKGRVNVVMSLFKTTSSRSYSLVINVDTNKQQVIVESYKLGSKYDRLM